MFNRSRQQSTIRNPQSAITLTEVLISMGVLTIGLLGVAALFPVGGHYMRTGEVADRGAAIAQAAFAEVVARDMLNPEKWMTHRSGLSRPFTSRFRLDYQRERNNAGAAPAGVREKMVNRVGSAFAIDPLAISRVLDTQYGAANAGKVARFPAEPAIDFAATIDSDVARPSWGPWSFAWPISRVSLPMPGTPSGIPGTAIPLNAELADSIFYSRDDLAAAFDVSAGDQPARQMWQTDASGRVLARESRGDYSWIVTVAPATNEARDALATNPSAYNYNVSVVVFHKRVIDDLATSSENEKLARARVVSTSLSGGELLLENTPNPSNANRADLFTDMKAGQWVMLFGPHPSSRATEPVLFLHWYRVISVEDEETALDSRGVPELRTDSTDAPTDPKRLVALRGPAWPWKPAGNLDANAELSNDLRVAIFPGAVAVHSRTLRLNENLVWDAR